MLFCYNYKKLKYVIIKRGSYYFYFPYFLLKTTILLLN
ncbi:hypothetical Protein psc1_05580 [Candidatus Phytoplasma solani]